MTSFAPLEDAQWNAEVDHCPILGLCWLHTRPQWAKSLVFPRRALSSAVKVYADRVAAEH